MDAQEGYDERSGMYIWYVYMVCIYCVQYGSRAEFRKKDRCETRWDDELRS